MEATTEGVRDILNTILNILNTGLSESSVGGYAILFNLQSGYSLLGLCGVQRVTQMISSSAQK